MELEFFVLGPLEVRCDGVEVPVRSGQQRVLLAALLLRANQVVPLAELTDRLWGEAPPRGARNTLRAYIMRLRRTLGADDSDGGGIGTHPDGYRIRVLPNQLDLLQFEELLRQAARAADAGPAREVELMKRATALWRGPALSNVDSDALHRDVVPALSERWLRAVQRRIDLELQLGGDDEVIPELRALTAEHPTRERFCAQLMLALYRSGRQADALAAYRRTRDLLAAELGVEPGQDLQELHRSVLAADPALEPARTPRARFPDSSAVLGSDGAALAMFEQQDQAAHPQTATELKRHESLEPVPLRDHGRSGPAQHRTRIPLGAGWLLATTLTIFAGVFDSRSAYFLGACLMAAVLLVTAAVAVTEARQRGSARVRQIRLARAATLLPLLAVGGLLAEVVVDYVGVAPMWVVPLFASALFVHAVVAGPVREHDAAGMGVAVSAIGAVTTGLLIGALALFAQRGMESSWTTGASVEGASATGKIRRTAHGEIQISGTIVDDKANYLGARLHIFVRRPGRPEEAWDGYNSRGRDSAEPIRDNRAVRADGLVVPGDATSIRVVACAADSDSRRQQVVDVKCGAPVEIWPQ